MASKTFDVVVDQCRLSPVFAQQVVARACSRAGLDANTLTAAQARALLPHLESALHVFVGEEKAKERVQSLQRLLASTVD